MEFKKQNYKTETSVIKPRKSAKYQSKIMKLKKWIDTIETVKSSKWKVKELRAKKVKSCDCDLELQHTKW